MDRTQDPPLLELSEDNVEIKQNFIIDDATPRKEQNVSFGNKGSEID